MSRTKRLRIRLGLWKAGRACGVALALVSISAYMAGHGESVLPLLGSVVGLVIPRLVLDSLVQRLPLTRQLLRLWGPTLVGAAILASVLRGRVVLSEQALLGGVTVFFFLANSYIGTLFWVVSDDRLTFSADHIPGLR